MAYSLETSSVKTIVPGAEVSGFCDVVARQKINELSGEVPQFSAGEGIDISTVDGKTVITNNISAGSNISLVYDMETNTYRIDNTGAGAQVVSSLGTNSGYMSKPTIIVKGVASWGLDSYAANLSFSSDGGSKRGGWLVPDGSAAGATTGNGNAILGWNTTWKEPAWRNISTINVTSLGDGTNYYKKTDTSSKQELSDAIDYVSANAGHTYTGDDPIYVNNETDHIGITGESLSAGPNIDIFTSGGYVVISANGGGEGAIYNGISPIDVNNTTHQISAKGVSFGVQNPLFFVQDDNEAVIIGCSAGGGTTYTGDAQGALDEVYANSGVWLTAHQSLTNYVSRYDTSVTIGFQNTATDSFSQGEFCSAKSWSFAQGSNNSAKDDSFAQGVYNKASDYYSFAQGGYNQATGTYSFAQGYRNSAASQSFAQGYSNSAYNTSLAQGANNTAYNESIAQGRDNYASNKSQAFGNGTKATNSGMAIGTYNKTESAAFVVGNGTWNNKSDAFIINHDGSVSAAGKISANGVELGAVPYNIVYTASLPAEPDANTLYLIPEA